MRSNRDIIHAAYEAFGRQDIPAVLAAFDASITWYSPDSVPTGGAFKGHDEVVTFFTRLPEVYEVIEVRPERYINSGDTVVVLGRHVGRGRGGSFDVPFVHVWTLDDGKATSFNEFFDTAKMNQALE
jgi:ketosteroid isomerase-like protein